MVAALRLGALSAIKPTDFCMQTIFDYFAAHGWIAEAFLIILLTAGLRLMLKVSLDRLARQAQKSNNYWDDALVEAGRRPAGIAVWALGISLAAEVVGGDAQAEIFQYIDSMRDVAVVWLLVWFALRFIRMIEQHYLANHTEDNSLDRTTASAVGKLLRATVAITGTLLVLQAFGVSVSGVLAFGGIGGIAIGFAARDLLANFFGALMIFLDRPFSVGDWVRSPDRDIEGTVEDIGWRLTRIRTFDKRPLYLPNSIFSSLAVENPSRMYNRRIYETIGLRYDDIGSMEVIVQAVRELLEASDEIDQKQILMVNFVTFGPSSVDFFIYAFTKTVDWQTYHGVKQRILLNVAKIIESHGAEIAFPTQTLHVVPEPSGGAQ
jgi:MscS family membrane protein